MLEISKTKPLRERQFKFNSLLPDGRVVPSIEGLGEENPEMANDRFCFFFLIFNFNNLTDCDYFEAK